MATDDYSDVTDAAVTSHAAEQSAVVLHPVALILFGAAIVFKLVLSRVSSPKACRMRTLKNGDIRNRGYDCWRINHVTYITDIIRHTKVP